VAVKEYLLPRSLDEATSLLAERGPSLLVIAGGTLAMPLINEGISMPEHVMGLRCAGLDQVTRSNGTLVIGATTTMTTMCHYTEIPLLCDAASNVAGWAIRNMGTVGGNLFAPPPAGDFATALLALDAQVKLVSRAGGERRLPLGEFYTGFLTNVLQPAELLAEIRVPMPVGRTVFLKFGRRHANTPAVVTVAAHVLLDGGKVRDARIALNAVGPHPVRARRAEASLIGSALTRESIAKAASEAAEECQPFTDAIASEWYRRKMAAVYVDRALSQVAA
jgi:CO/xanthine dehydrogenase FAD-binding subunit